MDHNPLVAQAKASCAPYADRKLSLVVPFKPGGGFDLMARALEPLLAAHSGMQVSVSNVTGGTGLLAMRTVVNAKADKPVVGLIDLGASAAVVMEGKGGLALSDLRGLGVISADQSVWVTKKAIDWQQTSGKPLLAATATNPFLRFGLPSHAMNFKARAVLGYQGTNDTWLAMLRGEVDAASMSDQSAVRNLATGVDARVSLILSDQPDPKFPGVPHLAGPGGMVDIRTQGMGAADRQRLMAMGELATMLSEQARTLVASVKLNGEVLRCLRHATEAAIFDPALAEVAKRQKFGLHPETAAYAQSKIEKIAQSIKENDKDLRVIAAQWKESH
jgi:tripartite-type tricarboxylate transporter receptor subunit TctC